MAKNEYPEHPFPDVVLDSQWKDSDHVIHHSLLPKVDMHFFDKRESHYLKINIGDPRHPKACSRELLDKQDAKAGAEGGARVVPTVPRAIAEVLHVDGVIDSVVEAVRRRTAIRDAKFSRYDL